MMVKKMLYHDGMPPIIYLVGGLEHEWIMTFHSVENVIITDELSMIFQRGRWLNHQPDHGEFCWRFIVLVYT